MTDKAKMETLTLIHRQSSNDTDGATHSVRNGKGDTLVVWPQSGVALYTNGTIAPCSAKEKQFDDLLRDLNKGQPLKWQKVGDHEEARVTVPAGKIEATCKAR